MSNRHARRAGCRLLTAAIAAMLVAGCTDWNRVRNEVAPLPVTGQVSGLEGQGLVLQKNGRDDLPIRSDGGFAFARSIPAGGLYSVTVLNQPTAPAQWCRISNGAGSVIAGQATPVAVTCTTARIAAGVNHTVLPKADGSLPIRSLASTSDSAAPCPKG